jgi:hypothetical protein
MRCFFIALLCLLLFTGCGMHAVRHQMAGTWYSTIENIDVALELILVQGTVTGGLKLLEDPDGELEKGMVLGIIEGTCGDGTVRLVIDVDRDGKKSEEDLR